MEIDTHDLGLKSVGSDHFLLDLRQATVAEINNTTHVMLSLLRAGFSFQEVSQHISESTGAPVDDVKQQLKALGQKLNRREWQEIHPKINRFDAQIRSNEKHKKVYSIGGKTVAVYFSNAPLMHENHSLLKPTAVDEKKVDHTVHIEEEEHRVRFFIDHKPWLESPELSWINGLLRHCLIELAYKAPSLLTLHAAAIAKDENCVLIIGRSGTGKSTLAAHMCLKGFEYLGDDSIPINMDTNQAMPLPTAVSLKPGSWSLLAPLNEELEQLEQHKIGEKTFRAWQPKASHIAKQPKQIRAVIFYERNSNKPVSLQQIPPKDALGYLQQAETRFNPDEIMTTLSKLVEWIHGNSIFTMNCANLNDGERLLKTLL